MQDLDTGEILLDYQSHHCSKSISFYLTQRQITEIDVNENTVILIGATAL